MKPDGTVFLLGVSEYPVKTNTRMTLEKGLTFIGSSRSGSKDFQNTVDIYSEHPDVVEYLSTLVGSLHTVENTGDLIKAFEEDLSSSWGKTVMRWKMCFVFKKLVKNVYIRIYKIIFRLYYYSMQRTKKINHNKAVFVLSREKNLQGNLYFIYQELQNQLP